MKSIIKQLLYVAFAIPVLLQAQTSVSGEVADIGANLPLPGVNISIEGTVRGAVTDFNGKFTIDPITKGQVLVFEYLGFKTKSVLYTGQTNLKVKLEEDVSQLSEVVLIGYGSAKAENVTGSLEQVSEKEFNQGPIVSPQELLRGKAPGVQVTSNGGDPGGGSRIRIRGGASLNSTNDPLIVIDGIPLDQKNIEGTRNVLNIVNPNDIKDFVVLKDAASTAIYGSRASNGVILITTKKGRKESDWEFGIDTKVSVGKVIKTLDVFSADELRAFVQENQENNEFDLLDPIAGVRANTDWQDAIFQDAIGTITDFSVSKGFKSTTLRASFNRSDQQGILKTDKFERNSLNTTITQDLFNDNLKLRLTSKFAGTKNRFADRGNIRTATIIDPTRPVNIGGEFFTYPVDGTETQSPINPLAALIQNDDTGTTKRTIQNFNAEYSLPFVPGLKFNLNLGLDYTDVDTRKFQDAFTVLTRRDAGGTIIDNTTSGFNRNQLLEGTVKYTKELEKLNTKIDAVAGYSYQEFFRSRDKIDRILNLDPMVPDIITIDPDVSRNLLISYFGRLNLEIANKYLISGSLRRDGSSRFNEQNQFGIFPGVSVGWKLHNEKFLENSKILNQLKLRAGWGVTGQQEIDESFPFLSTFQPSQNTASVQLGNEFVNTLRPGALNEDIKWEETTTVNLGLDFGFFNNRLSGSVDLYEKKTVDLLVDVPFAAGTNFTNIFVANAASSTNRGVELGINGDVFSTDNFNWNLAYNITFSENEIDQLTNTGSDTPIETGGIQGSRGNRIQIWKIGFDPTTYNVFRQIYDTDGNPIEGAYVDVNGDNEINDEDRVPYKKANPDVFMGLTSTMSYKNADFSFTFRGNFGGYNYRNLDSFSGNIAASLDAPGNYVQNLPADFANTNFRNSQLFSDYYLQSSDFVRLDNVSIGYTFNLEKVKLRISATGTNLLTFTDYDGLDPEVVGDFGEIGIDNSAYPRPRSYVFGVNVKF